MRIIKKILALGMAVLFLTACNKNTVAENVPNTDETTINDAAEEKVVEENINVGMGNPWEDVSKDEFDSLGVSLNIPNEASNVIYRIMKPDNLGEVDFTFDNLDYCARVQNLDAFTDISGLYYEWTVEVEGMLENCSLKSYRYVGDNEYVDLCLWYDGDQNKMYSLSTQAEDLEGFDLMAMVETIYGSKYTEVHVGETASFSTIDITVIDCQEMKALKDDDYESEAPEGRKYIVYTIKAVNTDSSSFTFNTDKVFLIDSDGNDYAPDTDIMSAKIEYRDMEPGKEEEGIIVYNVPEECGNYYILMYHADNQKEFHLLGR